MSDFVLTADNYYSVASNNAYLSNSLLKVYQECEYKFIRTLKGEYERSETDALIQGNLLDTMLTGNKEELEKFMAEHPEMYSTRGATKGELKSNFRIINQMYDKVVNDPVAMKYLNGEKQKIFTGNLFGVDMKCKLDVYHENKAIVDLKTCESITKTYWSVEENRRVSFVEYFKYTQQLAIYQELVRQNTGKTLPCYILAVSKEPITDIALIYFDNKTLHDVIHGNEFKQGLALDMEQIRLLKAGEIEPKHCGKCDLCMKEKKLSKPIHFTEILGEI